MIRNAFLICIGLAMASCSSSSPSAQMPQIRVRKISNTSSCKPLSWKDRFQILKIASPKNFPRAKYKMGPRRPANIEKETDCSRFVHEIYRRAGLRYAFRTTSSLAQAPEFDVLDEDDAKPGDLMLFRGHVGVVDKDGKIISATKVRSRKQSTITKMDRDNFKAFRGRRFVLRYRCQPAAPRVAQTNRR